MISINLNVLENAPSQFTAFDFDSMAVFDDKLILAGEDGLFEQDNSGRDHNESIISWVKFPNTDLGTPRQKRLRKAYLTYEAYGAGLSCEVYFDETLRYTEPVSPTNGLQETGKINGQRIGIGSTLAFRITNISGSDYRISSLDITPLLLGTKPSGANRG